MVLLTRPLLNIIKNPAFQKWWYGLRGYNKFGLYRNDFECLGVYPFDGSTEPLYNEALRRLPPDEYDRFVFRMIRCAQCEITKSSVPPEELPTYEEDETKGRFLEPFVREILAEKKEKEQWEEYLTQK